MNKKTRFLAQAGMIAALYVVLTHLQNFVWPESTSFAIQFRLSEALCVLAVMTPAAIPGLTIGCLVYNLTYIGALPLDWLIGSAATLLAALCTRALANVRVGKGRWAVASALPPVIFNGLIIGAELCWCIMGQWNWGVFIAQGVSVAAGEAVACVLGVLLVHYVETTPRLLAIFRG